MRQHTDRGRVFDGRFSNAVAEEIKGKKQKASGATRGIPANFFDSPLFMIKRFVKLTFRPEEVTTFLTTVFEPSKAQIRGFPGCQHMELLRSTDQSNVLFTFSLWDDAAALETYRQSDLFRNTWAKSKALFAEKAEAWSMEVVDEAQ